MSNNDSIKKANMGDSSGLLSRAAKLLNNKMFSDVEIQVKDGNNHKTFLAHKLILAMGGRGFASMFYNNNSESPNYIKIFDYKPQTVHLMLQYLYTDKLDEIGVEEAKSLYNLSKKYDIMDLQEKCAGYFSKDEPNLENLFEKYEFAVSENLLEGLRVCRNFVSSQTLEVLKSSHFMEASLPVVEDILKLDYLSVNSELDLIVAAINWAKQECIRRGSITENFRICLYPLFQHLRFLALNATEFCAFGEDYVGILNSNETTKILMLILNSSSDTRLPSGFSSNSCPREFPTNINSSSENNLSNSSSSDNIDLLSSDVGYSLDSAQVKPYEKPETFDMEVKIKDQLHAFGKSKPFEQKKKFEPKLNVKELLDQEIRSASKTPTNYPLLSPSVQTKNVNWAALDNVCTGYENLIVGTTINEPRPPSSVYKRSDSASIYSMKQSPVLKVSPQITMNQRMSFQFPLHELEKDVNSAFTEDIKCSATINVRRGAIEIHGIELRILQKPGSEEVIEAHLTLSGSNYPTKTKSYEEKLKNCIYPIHFSEPVTLSQNKNIKIEVVVEDLILNRCLGYGSDNCELNCGLGVMANITMKSNQYNTKSRESFYLISRLLYKVC